ncbi:MAG: DUF1156 domain-containing protein [Methanomicrobiaceae archaeon]|uniref:DUF1156 domain-containing protein n=1 Tax=Methanoculleus sp. TaxID=90427 RepID=UPI00321090B1|nr:DUF1156 domain-containing protein [Methanomicrobiaceae archaeon]
MSDERGAGSPCWMTGAMRIPRKLIEVALPLDEINVALVREKSIRQGHPPALHPGWARRHERMKKLDEQYACLLQKPERAVEEHLKRMGLVWG